MSYSRDSFWTETQIERLRELHGQGLPNKVIAERLGRSFGSVESKLNKLGIKRPKGYSYQPKAWPADQVAKLRELHDQGLSNTEIGAVLGRSEKAVSHKLHGLGLRRPAFLVKRRAAQVIAIVSKRGGWTEQELAHLAELHHQGLSAWEIGVRLGRSKNAVLGKLFRVRDGRPGNRPVTVAKIARGVSLPPVRRFNYTDQPPLPPITLADGASVAITDLQAGMCKWPIGDPKQPDFRFCGHPQHEGKPYCTAHCAIAYEPARTRARDAYHYRRAA